MSYKYTFANSLSHHGILGQRWGIRRFRNKDGSLTDAGKKRYSSKDVENDFNESIRSNNEAYKRIKENGNKISESADDLSKDYQKAFNNANLDSESKNRILKNLKEDFGNGCDDEDLYDMYLDDYVDDELMRIVESKVKNKRAAFDKLQEDYWDDVHTISKSIVEKYGDKKIKGYPIYSDGKAVVNDLIGKKLDTSFNSYIYRHFDDYWVNDTDEHYNAKERFKSQLPSMSEYNRQNK